LDPDLHFTSLERVADVNLAFFLNIFLTAMVFSTGNVAFATSPSCAEVLLQSPLRSNMPLVNVWMKEMFQSLANDYLKPDGRHVEHCGLIALSTAERLMVYGKAPEIIMYGGKRVGGGSLTLAPIRYAGRVKWGGHQVAAAEGLIYDPMLGYPVKIEDYPRAAFGNIEVVIEERKNATWIRWALSRRNR
jgi:hypothetical protein